ncbi:hypothetical protein ABEX13_15680 [Bacillus siamensis]|uniref:GapS4b family protein n=3 Tax=Bacillaceae TaxID=186817 RepID=UPI0002D4C321|nr:hypothetical protein [Bacillus siamensis]
MMENEKALHLSYLLPYGDSLKPLLLSSNLSNSDLKSLLADRGVFISDPTDENTIPILTTCLLAPYEFEKLKEKQKTKEDSIKRRSQSLKWNDEADFIGAFVNSEEINFNSIIENEEKNFEILGAPSFTIENKNEVILQYEIERHDLTKNWTDHFTNHKGLIKLFKNDNNEVQITMEHTSTETKECNETFMRKIVENFKKEKFIEEKEEPKKITSNMFKTEHRNKFLLGLLGNFGDLEFIEVTNIEFGPDTSVEEFPDEIKLLTDQVNKIVLDGKSLHSSDLLTDESYNRLIILEEIEASYKLIYNSHTLKCKINYGFPKLLKKKSEKNIEFEFNINNIGGIKHLNKRQCERALYDSFENFIAHKLKEIMTK